MNARYQIKRTNTADPDFLLLINQLDQELWHELNEDQATYDVFNKVPDIATAIVIYVDNTPAASGCFKIYDGDTVEIKRMFVEKRFRGLGLARTMLRELEQWALETGFGFAILETSIHFDTARNLYRSNGYVDIPNYDQYAGLEESVCMKKKLAHNLNQ